MNRLGILLICLSLSVTGTLSRAGSRWQWQDIRRGAQYVCTSVEINGSTQFISAVRYKSCRFRTDIVDAQCAQADSTGALAEKAGAFAAINGSYFNMRTLEALTFLKDEGREVASTAAGETFRTDGMLALKGRRVRIFAADTASSSSSTRRFREAIAAGPLLLREGAEVKQQWPSGGFFTKRHPRSLIGTDGRGWVYLIVIDGRFPGQAEGATIPETVEVARMFGLRDALNLDGGGSCALWIKEIGVVSHPYDNHRFDNYGQRIVPNIIAVR